MKEFVVYTLLLEAGLIGVFLSLDLFLFFVFFEAILIPMYFIIGIWGGERRIYAAIKFFLYTAFGSALMLAAIIAPGRHPPAPNRCPFVLVHRAVRPGPEPDDRAMALRRLRPRFRHQGPDLPPAHLASRRPRRSPDRRFGPPGRGAPEARAPMGCCASTWGCSRRPSVDFVPVLAVLAVIGIVYGAVVAIVQPDLKKLVAYSSVSHLGFIVLGTFALTSGGLAGGVIQNVNHGLTTGALFLLVGMIYDRRHTKKIEDFGGLAKVMPIYSGIFLFTAFASIGLPGLNGFVGEFMVLLGSFPIAAGAHDRRRQRGGSGCDLHAVGLRACLHRGSRQAREPEAGRPRRCERSRSWRRWCC